MPVVAAVSYQGVARDLIADLKYRRCRDGLPWMADAVVSAVRWADLSADAITWVPASRVGRQQRGFDQGRLLASAVGEGLGVSVANLLGRQGSGRQVGLDRAARAVGAAEISVGAAASGVRGAHILVIDDVVTTGASMAAAAAALRAAGASAVVGAAFAHKR